MGKMLTNKDLEQFFLELDLKDYSLHVYLDKLSMRVRYDLNKVFNRLTELAVIDCSLETFKSIVGWHKYYYVLEDEHGEYIYHSDIYPIELNTKTIDIRQKRMYKPMPEDAAKYLLAGQSEINPPYGERYREPLPKGQLNIEL